MAQHGTKDKPNIFARISKYFSDVRQEMKRVVWPSREEVVNSSVVVVATLAFFVLFTFVVDSISSWLFIDVLAKIGR
ncbi:MAG: preprotein translocase subunit SecE [Anaerosomatales bacterium]|nr:preprotein translocase subunit SecE [Anaerosomatales bacterium]